METIEYIMLSETNQREIDRDTDEAYDWYAEPYGRGHRLRRVQKGQENLFLAQGGAGPNWLKVVYH